MDYVEDTHGNVATNYYTPETNYYGANAGTTGVGYARGGQLSRIDYGLRDENGSIYAAAAPEQVVFTTAERCFASGTTCSYSNFNTTNASYWQDTPEDQKCDQGTVCNNHAPTFWSTKRLPAIDTYDNPGTGNVRVDNYALAESFPTAGDPELQLDSITRPGDDGGTGVTMPAISFNRRLRDNRVYGYNNQIAMQHWRLTDITTDTGSTISVSYGQPTGQDCAVGNMPSDPANNGTLCFPVYWQQDYTSSPTLDYFEKYVVTKVLFHDPNAIAPDQVTSYSYLGTPAWH